MTVGTSPASARLVEGILAGRQDVHRHAAQSRIGLQGCAQVVAIARPQYHVGDDQVRPSPLGNDQGLVHRSSGQQSVVLATQDHSKGLLNRQAVVGNQYAFAHRVSKQSTFDNMRTGGGQLRAWFGTRAAEAATGRPTRATDKKSEGKSALSRRTAIMK